MTVNFAAADAFIKAGNFKAAERLVRDVLTENPRDDIALGKLCDIHLEQKNMHEMEKAATDLLALKPDSAKAHMCLLRCYFERKDKEMAALLIQHYKDVAPFDKFGLEVFEGGFEVGFGDQASGYKRLAEFDRKTGDVASEHKYNSLAELKKGNIAGALREGERAFKAGNDSAKNAAYLSMLSYRMCRFFKCRMYARHALAKDRSLPIPHELLVLSWIVFFPPFMLAHVMLLGMSRCNESRILGHLFYFLCIPVGFMGIGLAYLLSQPIGLTFVQIVLLSVGFGLYQPFIGLIAKLFVSNSKKEISLKRY